MGLEEILIKLLLSVSFGALMGLDRDDSWKTSADWREVKRKSKQSKKKFSFIKTDSPASGLGGVRTYILISLLGASAGLAFAYAVYPLTWIITAAFTLFILTSFVLNYFDKNTFGLTTEISLILNFSLSLLLFATDIPTKVIVMIAVLGAMILSMRSQLRKWVSKFSGDEIVDTIKFVLFAVVLLMFMPNTTYGLADIPVVGEMFVEVCSEGFLQATEVFNPYQLWFFVALVLSLNFVGYFAIKAFGKSKGLNVMGFVGGLFSSTAVTETMARQSKGVESTEEKDQYVMSTVLANLTQFFRVLIIALILNLALGMAVAIPLVSMGTFMLFWVLFTMFRDRSKGRINNIEASQKNIDEAADEFRSGVKSPFALVPALTFAGLFLIVLTISSLALYYFGTEGFIVAQMIAALTGLDEVTISTASLAGDSISVMLGMIVIVLASCVNLLVKILFAAVRGDQYFRIKVTKIFIATIVVGVIAMGIVAAL